MQNYMEQRVCSCSSLFLFAFKLLCAFVWLFWITLTVKCFHPISFKYILRKDKLMPTRLYSIIIWYCTEWKTPSGCVQTEAILVYASVLLWPKYEQQQNVYESTMAAIDSNRILFHAIADVILWELFILFHSLAFGIPVRAHCYLCNSHMYTIHIHYAKIERNMNGDDDCLAAFAYSSIYW